MAVKKEMHATRAAATPGKRQSRWSRLKVGFKRPRARRRRANTRSRR